MRLRMQDIVYVLLYDTDYMAHVNAHPGYILSKDYIEEGERFNRQLTDLIPHHPGLVGKQIKFYQKPKSFISDLIQYHEEVLGILNFCDDYAERSALFKIPSLFEIYGIPYSGYTTKNLILAENKFYCYNLAKQLGIKVPATVLCTKYNFKDLKINKFPVFVKPNDGGGSEGIDFVNVVHSREQLDIFGQEMLGKYGEIVISEFLPGDEVTIGIMRRGEEIIPLTPRLMHYKGFQDVPKVWTAELKWDHHPKPGPNELEKTEFNGNTAITERLIADSIKIFHMMECKDFARLDWKFDATGVLKFLDFNENPMITEESGFYWCLAHKGFTLQDLIFAVIDNLLQANKVQRPLAPSCFPNIPAKLVDH
jgi:D-alanine-D-alanine ligase